MNKFEKALDRIKKRVEPSDDWTEDDIEHYKTVWEALEKQVSKKPNIWDDGVDEQGNLIYDMYDCPNCYKSYEIDYERYDYCPHCGQALLWED